jgi:hypothetical protein
MFSVRVIAGARRLRLHKTSIRQLAKARDLLALAGEELSPLVPSVVDSLTEIILQSHNSTASAIIEDMPGQRPLFEADKEPPHER